MKDLLKQKEIINQIVNNTVNFRKLVKRNWNKIDNTALSMVTKEYLTFIMYCAVFRMQNNDLSKTELDNFHIDFYQNIRKKGLLEKDELLEYEKLGRERYMDFYQTFSQGDVDGKRLNALIAKEALHIQKLLIEYEGKENALGELYSELFAVYGGLMLLIQLMFSVGNYDENV